MKKTLMYAAFAVMFL